MLPAVDSVTTNVSWGRRKLQPAFTTRDQGVERDGEGT